MKKLIPYIIVLMIIFFPRAFAQTTSNSEFNPFPQMEQDQRESVDDVSAKPEQEVENQDEWPPSNSDMDTNINRENSSE